ncbi:MAG: nucleotide pyrophosphohydrolase [Candidatus Muiribacterium halophilum]|uniref:Nucleotide pyrophosphohydrolase n=1 Tax=Muiribacterium halophilum TaxID=2053465 RepID=A0A2N5Z9D1_MUIH1|nr:MAG: nucleotide pyrophosphohydrolase [Candidatus Muirbacterium halophilum]
MKKMQSHIEDIYLNKDSKRSEAENIWWLMEETGELLRALRKGSDQEIKEEFADTLAWLMTIASNRGIDLEDAFWERYKSGCSKCNCKPCKC